MRSVWFLDVDGVINALSPIQQRHLNEFSLWDEKKVNGYKIRYSPEVIDFINRMSERVDIKWNTTWHHNAVIHLAPELGLKTFDVVNAIGVNSPNGSMNRSGDLPENRWWKMNTVINHIEAGGLDFIWTDDHLTPNVRNYIRRKADFEGLETSIITPDGELGLSRANLERIESFVDNLAKYGVI